MTADRLLSRIEGVRTTGPGRWLARCPAHDDRSPSLSVRELGDGRLLLHDFAGCEVADVLAAVGLSLSDMFPERAPGATFTPSERRAWNPADVLQAAATEALLVALVAGRIHRGDAVTAGDRARCLIAAGRLQAAVDLALPGRERRGEFRAAGRIAERDLEGEVAHA